MCCISRDEVYIQKWTCRCLVHINLATYIYKESSIGSKLLPQDHLFGGLWHQMTKPRRKIVLPQQKQLFLKRFDKCYKNIKTFCRYHLPCSIPPLQYWSAPTCQSEAEAVVPSHTFQATLQCAQRAPSCLPIARDYLPCPWAYHLMPSHWRMRDTQKMSGITVIFSYRPMLPTN